ncbi:uncharacterized protein LOC129244297 [Anastrepha obliqua]|uniref:uncharacterized protein LOC129244297 n=1 Tax=Anastrepha obliqua TaxID=95512 RepID=UPI0024095CF2|nr:uncharacterized protein LOC129244297 [Anastrepha obliqua]
MPKTPAERAREYRARKKLSKQEKPQAQTAAQRNRKYRARQKALRNAVATIGNNSSSTNFFGPSKLPIANTDNPQPSTSGDDGNILHKYLSQTSGQAEQAQVPVENTEGRIIVIHADVHQANPSQSPMNPTSTTSTKTRKSVAQRCREYRQRKKMREDANTIVVQRPVVSSVIVNVPSNEVEDRSNAIRTQKKCKDILKHDAETEIVLEPEADIEIKNEIDCLDDDDINKVTEIYEDISDQDSEPDAILDFEAEMDMKTDIELTNDEYTASGLNTPQINAPTLEPEADIEIKNEIDCLDDDDINKVTENYEDISDQNSEPDVGYQSHTNFIY